MKEKSLCHNCIEDHYLKALVNKEGDEVICDFCGTHARAFNLDNLSELVDQVFQNHFSMSFPDSSDQDKKSLSATEMIGKLGGFPGNAAAQIREILEDDYYSSEYVKEGEAIHFAVDTFYTESSADVSDLESEWSEFSRTLKTEARFFNAKGFKLLTWIFSGLQELSMKKVIVKAGPGHKIDHLFRARVFQSNKDLERALAEPNLELGPPPWKYATAGRMNAHGVSVFYGSNLADTAIAEVRPPVGAEVMVGKFDIIRELSILDLTSFPDLYPKGSLFDPVFSDKHRKTQFLKNLAKQMAIPVLPDDQAHEYLVTQAISDFLSVETSLNIDGIIYPSIQRDDASKNLILFHKSSRVETIEHPENVKISGRFWKYGENGAEKSYLRQEEKITDKKVKAYREINPWGTINDPYHRDERKTSLRVNLDKLSVHQIKAVYYPKTVHPVVLVQEDHSIEDLPF